MTKNSKRKAEDLSVIEPSIKGEEVMPWSKLEVDNAVLAFWPGTLVRQADIRCGPKGIHGFFKKVFDIEVQPVGCVETLPDADESGGRQDFFFFVDGTDLPKFVTRRFEFGMRWWEDVYFNHGEGIYPPEFLKAYPKNPKKPKKPRHQVDAP